MPDQANARKPDPPPTSEAGTDTPAPSFELAVEELERLVAGMESGELSLEQSLAAYKRGAYLLQVCQSALQDAQQQVKILEDGLLRDFQDGNEQD
ncbi:MAG: exodeoxyribonuclease VII small subunit [Burkholderiales bacterium]|nr:exodeoxyribonuclease VII small subunit [Burkholderiales bacterium]